MIDLPAEICTDLTAALRREWLETNGLGGYASATVAGMNTRRYHGLLVASLRPPVERYVLLSKLEETLVIDGRRYELGVNRYPGVIHPQGHRHLVRFRLDPFPVFTYRVEGVELEKALFMVHGENTTVVRYALRDSPEHPNTQHPIPNTQYPTPTTLLEVRPLIAFRDYHSLTHENGALDVGLAIDDGRVSVRPYAALPALHLAHDPAELSREGFWFRSFQYDRERERGLDWEEDLFSPFVLTFDLGARGSGDLIASLGLREAGDAAALAQAEVARRRELENRASVKGCRLAELARAADQFLVARQGGKTIIAGYPWFADWGRDTMIALPGLTLATGRPEIAREILLKFARHVDQGMLPNRFPDHGEAADYNTVDATLWFFEAARALGEATGDYEWIRDHLYAPLVEIVDRHVRGTRHGIRMDTDSLLHAGEEGVQLTWMDAKIGDWVVTPRTGKPVEIQALWYHALRVMEDLSGQFGDPEASARYAGIAARARRSFNRRFWNADAGCLYDCLNDDDSPDPSIRPNQILAVSLAHGMLSSARAKEVVQTVQRHLLTPYGLRSLAPEDARYRGRYEGDPRQRDSTYHQGAVWGWLMGPFLTAYVRVHGGSAKARRQAGEWLEPLRLHLSEAGLGQVSELFDGDPPHTPRGCIAQAWSVGELLRVAVEDVPEIATRRRGILPCRSSKSI